MQLTLKGGTLDFVPNEWLIRTCGVTFQPFIFLKNTNYCSTFLKKKKKTIHNQLFFENYVCTLTQRQRSDDSLFNSFVRNLMSWARNNITWNSVFRVRLSMFSKNYTDFYNPLTPNAAWSSKCSKKPCEHQVSLVKRNTISLPQFYRHIAHFPCSI